MPKIPAQEILTGLTETAGTMDPPAKKPKIKTSIDGSPYRPTEETRLHCMQLAVYGEAYFDLLGWNMAERDEFLSRRGVQLEMARLTRLFKDQDNILKRRQLLAQIFLHKMVDPALNTIARGMRGDKINKNTGLVEEPAPTEQQLRCAMDILNRAGVVGKPLEEITPAHVDNRSVHVHLGAGSEGGSYDATLVRERVRNQLSQLLGALGKDAARETRKMSTAQRYVSSDAETTPKDQPADAE